VGRADAVPPVEAQGVSADRGGKGSERVGRTDRAPSAP